MNTATDNPVEPELEQLFQELLTESREILTLSAEACYEVLSEKAEDLTKEATRIFEKGETCIRDYPGPALLGALALGVLAGLWIGRK